MGMGDDISVQRELGAISQHLQSVDSKLGELVAYQKAQNGRVGSLESKVAVLTDAREHDTQERERLHDRLKDVEGRGRMWALGVGGPVLASFVLVLLQHG